MRTGRVLALLFQSLTAGLAAAFVIVVFFPGLLGPGPAAGVRRAGPPPAPAPAPGPAASFAGAVARAAPAVVNVATARGVAPGAAAPRGDPLRRRFPGDAPGAPQRGLGSGVILDPQGYILTNGHVVAGADRIEVMLRDGREAAARMVGADADTDLAVLKIELEELPALAVGSDGGLQVGDVVLAIGNPFGVGQTVTMGIVSATGRNRLGINTYEDFIQTDAAINPGNSGGALVNSRGELVGINTAIFSRSGGSEGIGFAIPAGRAVDVMRQIVEQGFVARGWLGIAIQDLTPALAESFRLDGTAGVLVARVFADGPAAAAGLRPGDVITRVGARQVGSVPEALEAIAATAPGSEVALRVVRDGAPREMRATVVQRPPPPPAG